MSPLRNGPLRNGMLQNGMLGWAAALLLAAGFAALGHWQYGRAAEKETLLADAVAVLEARDPIPLAAASDLARAGHLGWAAGDGRFADSDAFLLDNQRHDGRVGVRAYRVFLPDDGAPLLVDLGWLPIGAGRSMPQVPTPAGDVAVRGLLAPPPSPGLQMGEGMARAGDDWLLTRVDPDAITRAAGLDAPLAPRVLRLDPALPFGHPRDLEVLPNTVPPERHLGYAVQWFGLAATVLIVALVLTLRCRRNSTGSRSTP